MRLGLGVARVAAGLAALVGFALAAAVQAFSLAGVDVEDGIPVLWPLHLGAMATFGLAVLVVIWLLGGQRSFQAFLSIIPIWGRIVIGAGWLYGLAAFALASAHDVPSGAPEQQEGRYYFNNHGVRTEVSKEEFHAGRALELQGFSAVWITFFLFAAVVLLSARKEDPHASAP